jgi:hypothetical protein
MNNLLFGPGTLPERNKGQRLRAIALDCVEQASRYCYRFTDRNWVSWGMPLIRIILSVLLCSIACSATAADLEAVMAKSCLFSPDSQILGLKRAALISTVTQYRDDAKLASSDKNIVFSKSAAFDWAVATTVQCNVALGYLNGGHVDKESTQKCDCFHGRLLGLE